MERTGCKPETFAQISVKSRRHAAANPYAVFTDPVTVEEVLASPTMFGALTRLQCCPPTCGAAAALLVSDEFAAANGIRAGVAIKAMTLASDSSSTFTSGSVADLVGAGVTRRAARQVYEEAGVDPTEIPVVELHDCFTVNEILTYEALGLTPDGTAEKFVSDGQNTYGGQAVVNPSGGLLSKGHPLGATGLAQCAELNWQLRDMAADRQVPDAKLAMQHNLGLGGACVMTMYRRD
jgi:acetyl-CoA acyltransferase